MPNRVSNSGHLWLANVSICLDLSLEIPMLWLELLTNGISFRDSCLRLRTTGRALTVEMVFESALQPFIGLQMAIETLKIFCRHHQFSLHFSLSCLHCARDHRDHEFGSCSWWKSCALHSSLWRVQSLKYTIGLSSRQKAFVVLL